MGIHGGIRVCQLPRGGGGGGGADISGINASLATPLLEYVIRFLKINVYHYYFMRSPGIYWDTADLLSTFDQVVARFHRVTCYDLTQC